MTEQMGHFRLTVGKPGTYSNSCIMAIRTYVLISLLLTLGTQYISMVVHLNGSAVQTFFSQVKHATSGQLSSLKYAIARGAVITRGSVHGKLRHHCGDYRNAPLFI